MSSLPVRLPEHLKLVCRDVTEGEGGGCLGPTNLSSKRSVSRSD